MRDGCHILNPYDLSFFEALFLFSVGWRKVAVEGREIGRVRGATGSETVLLRPLLRVSKIVDLGIAVGVVSIIVSGFVAIGRF